jgi:hypothetical protein
MQDCARGCTAARAYTADQLSRRESRSKTSLETCTRNEQKCEPSRDSGDARRKCQGTVSKKVGRSSRTLAKFSLALLMASRMVTTLFALSLAPSAAAWQVTKLKTSRPRRPAVAPGSRMHICQRSVSHVTSHARSFERATSAGAVAPCVRKSGPEQLRDKEYGREQHLRRKCAGAP